MEFGAHLPLIDFGAGCPGLPELRAYTQRAAALGFTTLCANDHLVFQRPWLDGPTALAAVIAESGSMQLATTVALPVVRGPIALAKTLVAIDRLSGGRLTVGVGPGSSAADYAAVGVPFEERWSRLDEAVKVLRALFRADAAPVSGRWYSSDVALEPRPATPPGPPIWIGSWGSGPGLRRVARLADGWLASGYNTTPERFAAARKRLHALRMEAGADDLPNGIATCWFYVSSDEDDADRVRAEMAAVLNRPEDDLRTQLPIGTPEQCAALCRAYAAAGAGHLFLWPVRDPTAQLEAFATDVRPLLD
jgi:alkanesulfonate monooxygenase SsuD/methylene tetrahydromethanopterin reductase-like flavin-dependent oxidoreductase (luciferase family)